MVLRSVLLGVLPLCVAPPAIAQGTPDFEIPLDLLERADVTSERVPVTVGVPFPEGLLKSPIELEFAHPAGDSMRALGTPLARWPDGSVRWLSVDFEVPELAAGQRILGTLRPDQGSSLPRGKIEVGMAGGVPAWVENGEFRIDLGFAADRLLALSGARSGNLSNLVEIDLRSNADWYTPVSATAGAWEIERRTALTLRLARSDRYFNAEGRPVLRLTSRIRIHRGNPAIRIQQSLDVLAGVHQLEAWSLTLPFAAPGPSAVIATSEEQNLSVNTNTSWQQITHDLYVRDGAPMTGQLPGAIGLDGTRLVLEDFWQLHPMRFERRGADVSFEFGAETDGRPLLVEEGFGRTMNLHWWVGPNADAHSPADRARSVARPLRAVVDAEWCRDSGALGALPLPDPLRDQPFEHQLADSTILLFDRRESDPYNHYGFQNFGDFFDREHTIGYWGSMQLEYDPPLVLMLQSIRSGDTALLDRALELSWHYADVDIAWYGGAFQHRATNRHIDAWVAEIFSTSIRKVVESDPEFTGSLHSAIRTLRKVRSNELVDDVVEQLDEEIERGTLGEEQFTRLYLIAAQLDLLDAMDPLKGQTYNTIRDYADAIQGLTISRKLGFHDVDEDFEMFFARYGGDWNDFPNFHVGVSPAPAVRHDGGHSLIESVTLAHYLTGEPRLREVALALADHHVRYLIPRNIETLRERWEVPKAALWTRRLAWPLINAVALAELTEGNPKEVAIHDALVEAAYQASGTLCATPVNRVRSSIHGGLQMEALAKFHRLTGDVVAANYLQEMSQYWSETMYDWDQHAFRYLAEGSTFADSSMTGLVIYGLSYADQITPQPNLRRVLVDAWEHLPTPVEYSKSFGMHYRGSFAALGRYREILLQPK